MLDKQVAHFFWQGELSLYEHKCIGSFVKHNFDVNVWSYQSLELPEGAKLRDASEILPKTELNTFKVWNPELNAFSEIGGINSGFSDLFRFALLSKHGGWWFDTDVVCLRDQSEFALLTENRHIVAGAESNDYTNGAILNFPSKETNELALKKCLETIKFTRDLEWGIVGPKLITNFILEQQLTHEVYDQFTFYPLNFNEVDHFLNPALCGRAEEVSSRAYTIHLWNWVLVSKLGLNKQVMPPEGSYLYNLFTRLGH